MGYFRQFVRGSGRQIIHEVIGARVARRLCDSFAYLQCNSRAWDLDYCTVLLLNLAARSIRRKLFVPLQVAIGCPHAEP